MRCYYWLLGSACPMFEFRPVNLRGSVKANPSIWRAGMSGVVGCPKHYSWMITADGFLRFLLSFWYFTPSVKSFNFSSVSIILFFLSSTRGIILLSVAQAASCLLILPERLHSETSFHCFFLSKSSIRLPAWYLEKYNGQQASKNKSRCTVDDD